MSLRAPLALVLFVLAASIVDPASPAAIADVILECPPWDFGCRSNRPEPSPEGVSPLLLGRTSVKVTVTGPVAHVVVTQAWSNPNADPIDALYIFPLPEKAAVTDMRIAVGERVIRSEIRRREEARRMFEQARREGRLAGLLDQERPNVFAQEIANLMPGAAVEVILELDQEVACEDETCEYVFPTVVGPRFIPRRQTDPGRIDPPVIGKGQATGQVLTVDADIDPGVPLRDLGSPSHRVRIVAAGSGRWRALLDPEERSALDRDFRLRWTVGGARAEIGLLAWREPIRRFPTDERPADADDAGVVTLVVQPPAAPRDEEVLPRELVFVLDCSGSMSGEPLAAAKEVVRRSLRAIRPGDTFQIIRFSEGASGLGAGPIPPTPENIRTALRYLDGLQGEGGTEMIAGIRAALGFPGDPRRLRIVAFLTDGYIGNEREILAEVRRRLGNARLFSFGIGSSVNRYLLESLAEEGRGAAAFVAPRESTDDLVARFVRRIDAPVLTDITVAWEGVQVQDVEPALVPDLFAGQPLLLHARYARPGSGHVVVEGRRAGRLERLRSAVVFPESAPGGSALARLWARARIHRLDAQQHDGEVPAIKESIALLGLRYRLMTAYTSLVAVDDRISNATGSATRVEVPVEMPLGVSYEGIFGGETDPKFARQVAAMRAPSPGFGGIASSTALQEGALQGYAPGREAPGKAAGDASGLLDGIAPPSGRGEQARGGRPAPQAFNLLTLVRADGTRVIVENDGDVWVQSPRARRLVRRLASADLDTLRAALASARPSGWSGTESGERLVVEISGAQWVVSLPARDPAVAALVAMLAGWGS